MVLYVLPTIYVYKRFYTYTMVMYCIVTQYEMSRISLFRLCCNVRHKLVKHKSQQYA